MFASMLAPFVGFFASGFKRSVGIKDFAANLPGHGGWLDRFDCISAMSIFSYILCRTLMMRDEHDVSTTYQATNQLPVDDRVGILNALAKTLKQPGLEAAHY